jgi:hypothetical protein
MPADSSALMSVASAYALCSVVVAESARHLLSSCCRMAAFKPGRTFPLDLRSLTVCAACASATTSAGRSGLVDQIHQDGIPRYVIALDHILSRVLCGDLLSTSLVRIQRKARCDLCITVSPGRAG